MDTKYIDNQFDIDEVNQTEECEMDFDNFADIHKMQAASKFNKRAKGKKAKERNRHRQESAMYGEW